MESHQASVIFSFVLFFFIVQINSILKDLYFGQKFPFLQNPRKPGLLRGIYGGLLTCSPSLQPLSPFWLWDCWSDVHFLVHLHFVYCLDFHRCKTLVKRIPLFMCFHGFTWARLAPLLWDEMVQVLDSFKIVNLKLAYAIKKCHPLIGTLSLNRINMTILQWMSLYFIFQIDWTF